MTTTNKSLPVSLGDRIVFDGESFSSINRSNALTRATLLAETVGSGLTIKLGDSSYRVNFTAFAAAIKDILRSLTEGESDRVLTQRQLMEYASFLTPLTADEARNATASHASYTTRLYHGGQDWPIKGTLPGIVVVMGDTGSGKTDYLLKRASVDVIVRFGEPLEYLDASANVFQASSLTEAIGSSMLLSVLGFNVAIDSIRSLVYGLKGAAMEGGMVATLFDLITQLNNLVAETGHVIFVAVNPMLADSSKADRLYLRIAASAAGAVHIVDQAIFARTLRLDTGRTWKADHISTQGRDVDTPISGPPYRGVDVSRLVDGGLRDSVASAYFSRGSADSEDVEVVRPAAPFTL